MKQDLIEPYTGIKFFLLCFACLIGSGKEEVRTEKPIYFIDTDTLLESIKYPLAVILSVPFSLLGVMAGSLFNDLAFDRGAIAGTLLCIGVVVNNAILLIHEHQSLIQKGVRGLRNWMYVYERKLRAILITSVTTISGLIPMIVFGSDEFWETLAVVVVWGLSFSTVLLLLFFGYWKRSSGEQG